MRDRAAAGVALPTTTQRPIYGHKKPVTAGFRRSRTMSAFADLPIARKLVAAFAAVVAVIFVGSAVLYDRLRVIEEAKNWRVHTTDVLETLQIAIDAMLDQETGVRGY